MFPAKTCFTELVFFFSFCHDGILAPQSGMEPETPGVEIRSPNHWTVRDFPRVSLDRIQSIEDSKKT